jgi:hypothetical protein
MVAHAIQCIGHCKRLQLDAAPCRLDVVEGNLGQLLLSDYSR